MKDTFDVSAILEARTNCFLSCMKITRLGVPVMAQRVTNPTGIHVLEDMGSIPGLTQWVKDLALL